MSQKALDLDISPLAYSKIDITYHPRIQYMINLDANSPNDIPLTKGSKYGFVLPASPFLDMLSCLSSSRDGATINQAPVTWWFF